jgi:hypothetical protein
MELNQAASASPENCLLVGRNSRGHWIVRDRSSRHGGLFASLAAAQRYARVQNVSRDATIVMVPGCLELDLSAPSLHVRKRR